MGNRRGLKRAGIGGGWLVPVSVLKRDPTAEGVKLEVNNSNSTSRYEVPVSKAATLEKVGIGK